MAMIDATCCCIMLSVVGMQATVVSLHHTVASKLRDIAVSSFCNHQKIPSKANTQIARSTKSSGLVTVNVMEESTIPLNVAGMEETACKQQLAQTKKS